MSRFADLQAPEKLPPAEKQSPSDTSPDSGELYFEKKTADGRVVLTEDRAYQCLGFSFPRWKKWWILSVVFFIQASMNFNTSGHNIGSIIIGRFLGGLSSAGGSVTLALVADLFDDRNAAEDGERRAGLNAVVFSSVAGSVWGPLLGGFIEQFAPNPQWRWTFLVQIIWGALAQLLHLFTVPETRSSVLLDREAKIRRKEAAKEGKELNIWGPNEVIENRLTMKGILTIWARPFWLLVREPVVTFCSLLSGFSDMLIFIFLDSYGKVFGQWDFQTYQVGLAFIPIMIAYALAWISFIPWIRRDVKRGTKSPGSVAPESRLEWLLWTVWLEPIGLIGFAWTSGGPSKNHWMGPMFFSSLIGIANYCIYAYGPYSGSATGGNGFARDMLAGIAAIFAGPFYEHFKEPYTLEYPSTILACIGVAVAVPVPFLYKYGPQIRKSSKFAQELAAEKQTTNLKHQVRDEKAQTTEHIENV